ncbi:MAG TPA: alkaline phosphatase family protein [Candidatus Acidoferrales bacterium]|nr:alkaline phosphatase family protein [Candidatus Acidoferrales bacterium]
MALPGKIIVALVYVLAATGAIPGGVYSQPRPKAIVLAWDGAVPSFVHQLLQRGKLPNLAKLIEGGAFADDVVPVFPSKTAPGFASLMTGASPRATGISGNRVPRTPQRQSTIFESSAGFNNSLLRAEPLWANADRAGLSVFVADVPLGGDRSEHGIHIQGYTGIVGSDGVVTGRNSNIRPAAGWENLPPSDKPPLEMSFAIGPSSFFGLFIGDPGNPEPGYDTLLITTMRNAHDIKAQLNAGAAQSKSNSLWSGLINLKRANDQIAGTYLRLFDLKRDGKDFLLYFTRPTRDTTSPAQRGNEIRAAAGAFIGNGASDLYSQGAFGSTIPNGGDGTAEARYLETVSFVQHQLIETSNWALSHFQWDLLLAYTPFPDEAEHLWRGYLDASLPGYRQGVANRLRPFLEDVYGHCDEFLGLFLNKRPNNSIVALISDHGMEGVNKLVAINRILQQHGLLVMNEQGRVDASKTKAFYPSINNGYLLINSTNRKNGIVPPDERAEIVQRLREALFRLRDGARSVITDMIDAQTAGAAMGIGGESGGDIYIDLLPGYEFDGAIGPRALIAGREPHGNHGFNPQRPSMRTIMALNGPGIAAGRKLSGVRIIDFAPTLAALLGLPPLKDASGKVLEEAFTTPR